MSKKNTKPKFEIYRYSASISNARTVNRGSKQVPKPKGRKIPYVRHILFLLILVSFIIFSLSFIVSKQNNSSPATNTSNQTTVLSSQYCSGNTNSKLVVVSINRRRMWACNRSNAVYSSVVITGNQNLASDLTPIGNYKIFAKIANTDLIGSNSNTSWNDHVNYWMPFLQNQYGQYGFHDATWRVPNEFGNISPYSINASHGCVELPIASASWLYSWVKDGTNVSIVN